MTFSSEDILSSVFADNGHASIRKEQVQFNKDHFYELCGMCAVTVDVCASIEEAIKNAAHRGYWEIWEVKEGVRVLRHCAPTPTFKTFLNISGRYLTQKECE